MNAVVAFNPMPYQFRALAAAAIAHALIVLLLWLGAFYADLDLILEKPGICHVFFTLEICSLFLLRI